MKQFKNITLKNVITMEQFKNIILKNVITEKKLAELGTTTIKKLPKIVGETRHYPPANKEWRNSIYAFNKNNIKSLPVLDKMASKTIKSYFNLSNNKKLARSKRMRNLIRRSTVKRLFVSRPEVKQTSDKVNVTVYTFDREKQFLLRKMYFYNRNMYLDKDIYLYKLWLKRNLLAFKKTFTRAEYVRLLLKNKKLKQKSRLKTSRNKKNKTYIHNILLNKYLNGNSKALSMQNKPILTHKIKRSLFISLTKRNIIRSLKKREMKRGFSRLNIAGDALFLRDNKTLALHHKAKNYFANKITRKVRLILHNKHNIFKIKQKLKKLRRSRYGKIRLPYSNLKFKNEIKFFSFRLFSELKYIRKLFFYYFIKYIISLFQIKIKIEKKNNRLSRLIYEFTAVKEIEGKKNSSSNKKKNKRNKKKTQFINRYSYDKLKNVENLNLELLNFLKLTLAEAGVNGQLTKENLVSPVAFKLKIDSLYKKFENSYFLTFLSKFFKKEFLYLNYYGKFLLNKLKFGKFLPGLKLLISKIYSKKVELNIVNLKYPHLNSDIYTSSIVTKLRKKIGLLRVLRWSLKLARLPYKYYSNNNAANLNKLQNLNVHKALDINSSAILSWPLGEEKTKFNPHNGQEKNIFFSSPLTHEPERYDGSMSEDRLHVVLNKLYPHTLARNFSLPEKKKTFLLPTKPLLVDKENIFFSSPQAKNISVLNIIRYKWVSGVRLEAAGRLTRRYTAARSVFKFRYKGNLKNIDYSLKTDSSKKNISTVMLRNYVKSNSQYSFAKSKRRIGAFGLKAWISSY